MSLTFEKMNVTGSIEELVELYSLQDLFFEQEEDLLAQVRKDWKREWNKYFDLADISIPDKLPSRTISIDGTIYHIHGVFHTFNSKYKKTLKDLLPHENVLTETWIGLELGVPETDIYDQFVETVPEAFLQGLQLFLFPWRTIPNALKDIKSQISKSENNPWKDIEFKAFHIPSELLNPEPACVTIELQERVGKYKIDTRRSAYQAEFLRHYYPKEKHIIVGAGHVGEIVHFLQRGVRDEKVVSLAREIAELYNSSPEEFLKLRHRKRVTNLTANICGFVVGYMPYLGALSLI